MRATSPSPPAQAQSQGPASLELSSLLGDAPAVEVTEAAERVWRLQRHRLLSSEPADPVDLAIAHVGLHAARQLTPWVTMHARDSAATPHALRRALRSRALLRVRCMRRTLHLLPPSLAATAHVATLSQRLSPCRLERERQGLTPRVWGQIQRDVLAALDGRELDHRELEREVRGPGRREAPSPADSLTRSIRLAIKTLWESGELLIGDASPSLHHEHRTFAITREAVPGLDLNALGLDEATEELLHAYLTAYGPVSVRDFSWWSGISFRQTLPAWQALTDQLVHVRIAGHDENLVALRDTVEHLEAIDENALSSQDVHVLAYEDPSLKGYFSTRWRYASPAHLPRLFNSIGEARASALIGGQVAAVWHWDRPRQAPVLEPLRRLAKTERVQLRTTLDAAQAFLRQDPLLASGSSLV